MKTRGWAVVFSSRKRSLNKCVQFSEVAIANACIIHSLQVAIHSSRDQWEASMGNCAVGSLTITSGFFIVKFTNHGVSLYMLLCAYLFYLISRMHV